MTPPATLRAFTRVSASQIDDHLTCKRLWWFKYVLGIKTKQKASAALGEMVHTLLENYLNHGTPIDITNPAGKIAILGMPYLPKPGSVLIEMNIKDHPANNLKLLDIDLSGKIDVLQPEPSLLEVLDHKTSGNLAYAKTREELMRNPQMLIYGKFAVRLLEWAGVPREEIPKVKLTHVVYPTQGSYTTAKHTSVDVTPDHIDEHWPIIEAVVAQMKATATYLTPGDVEPTKSACSKYGGCDFRDRCNVLNGLVKGRVGLFASTPASTGENMGAIDDLKARKAAEAAATAANGGAGASTGGETQTPAATQQPAAGAQHQTAQGSLLERLKQQAAAQKTAGETPPAGSSVLPPDAPAASTPAAVANITGAGAAGSSAGSNAAADTGAKSKRPRNYKVRLAALGYTEDQIEKTLSPEDMHTILDGKVASSAWTGSKPAAANAPSNTSSTPKINVDEIADGVWFAYIDGTAIKGADGKKNKPFTTKEEAEGAATAEVERIAEAKAKAEAARIAAELEAAHIAKAKAEAEASIKAAAGEESEMDRAEREAWGDPSDENPSVEVEEIADGIFSVKINGVKLLNDKGKARSFTSTEAALAEADRVIASDRAAALEKAAAERVAANRDDTSDSDVDAGLTLYIDCVPEKGPHADRSKITYLESYLAPYMAKAAESEKVAHYSLISFGKGPAFMAAFMLQEPPSGVVVCNTRFPATNACLEVLMPRASRVVKAW